MIPGIIITNIIAHTSDQLILSNPSLRLRLGVDLVFPLSQEQEVEQQQQQQQEPSPKSKLEFDTKDQVLFLTLLNGYTYSFETY